MSERRDDPQAALRDALTDARSLSAPSTTLRPPVPWMVRVWWRRLAERSLGEDSVDPGTWVLDDVWRLAAQQAGEWAA